MFKPVWANKIQIGTSSDTSTPPVWTYSDLCKGIESMSFNSNEQNQQYFFLCGEGFANNEVTGGAPELQISGRRIAGDAAQDYERLSELFARNETLENEIFEAWEEIEILKAQLSQS